MNHTPIETTISRTLIPFLLLLHESKTELKTKISNTTKVPRISSWKGEYQNLVHLNIIYLTQDVK